MDYVIDFYYEVRNVNKMVSFSKECVKCSMGIVYYCYILLCNSDLCYDNIRELLFY